MWRAGTGSSAVTPEARGPSHAPGGGSGNDDVTWLQRYMAEWHVPAVLGPGALVAWVGGALVAALLAGVVVQRVHVGLDQAIALPRDSYLQVCGGGDWAGGAASASASG